MVLLGLLLTLVWIVADFSALIYLYFQFGLGAVVALLVGTALLGVVLFRWQLKAVWREFQAKLLQADLPDTTAAEGLLLFLATCLLIAPFPGMDLIGLLLMIAPLRRWVARRIRGWVAQRFEPGPGSFVFQMGGIASAGWPPPAYPEATPGLDPNNPAAPVPPAAGGLPGAGESTDDIEEGEFRPVPSNE